MSCGGGDGSPASIEAPDAGAGAGAGGGSPDPKENDSPDPKENDSPDPKENDSPDPKKNPVTEGPLTSIAARAVGAWGTTATNCASGSDWNYSFFLCPGGRIRGGGEVGNVTELVCGTYRTEPPLLPNCSDRIGCLETVVATVTSTLILGGQSDVSSGQQLELYLSPEGNLLRSAACTDGSSGLLQLERVPGEVGDDYCVSEACPLPGGNSGGGYGSCGTDCDCGRCWYCDGGECRYGGEGPFECYRGCSG